MRLIKEKQGKVNSSILLVSFYLVPSVFPSRCYEHQSIQIQEHFFPISFPLKFWWKIPLNITLTKLQPQNSQISNNFHPKTFLNFSLSWRKKLCGLNLSERKQKNKKIWQKKDTQKKLLKVLSCFSGININYVDPNSTFWLLI